MHGHIRDRKKYPFKLSFLYYTFAIPKHIDIIDTALLLCRSIQVSYYDW